ncbi:hypothetical protein PIB30_004530 [Stylosanthes scabra]|uniref:Uncharacterized protein n=1 Tax=Stylosanthes scabra TaxID=79078 RepID=A0ABU6Y5F4_9FABA|nr:hypothetical protein [Stylosanthes scabra]
MGEGHDKEGIGGMEPPSRRSMLTRKIPRKRFLFHLPCLWPSIQKKDYLRYIEELRRRPELSPLRSRQASVSDSSRSQLIDSLPVITLQAMISVEFGNHHCRVRICGISIVGAVDGVENWDVTPAPKSNPLSPVQSCCLRERNMKPLIYAQG